jgi:ATP-dependent Clp protease ATP-binding subunit ClpC
MEANFSNRVRDVISYSREEALRLGHDYIGTEHLLLGLIREGEGYAIKLLVTLGVDVQKLRKAIEDSVKITNSNVHIGNIPLTKQAEKVLKLTYLEARYFKSDLIGTEHLLLSLLRDDDNIAAQILSRFGITYEMVKHELENSGDEIRMSLPTEPGEPAGAGDSGSSAERSKKNVKSKTPVLDNFGRDLTRMAEDGKLDPIIGRAEEIERVAQAYRRPRRGQDCHSRGPGPAHSAAQGEPRALQQARGEPGHCQPRGRYQVPWPV